jgi:hypothetical protein
MTALCGGGTSSPQAGVEDVIVIGANGLQIFGLIPGMEWLQAIGIAGGALLPITLANLCATDPPAMPTFTLAEVIAATTNQFASPDWLSFNLKVRDVVLNLSWHKWCKCDTGAQPAAATAPTAPSGYAVLNSPSQGFCLPMKAANVKVLNLWNGTTNVAPPANWNTEAFDDSAWATAQVASTVNTFGGPITPLSGYSAAGAIQQIEGGCATPADPVAPWIAPTSGKENFLFRWHFDLPQFSYADIRVTQQWGYQAGGGWSSGAVYVNGSAGGTIFTNVAGWGSQIQRFRVGRNLMAGYVNSANAAATTWGTGGWISEYIQQKGIGLPYTTGVNCCPTDPAIIAMLQRIQDQVDLVQRQVAPFSYIPGASHTGLTGTGEFNVQGLLGLAVDVTTLPARAGRLVGTPDVTFDIGWLTAGTADGWVLEHRIRSDGFLWLPYGMSAMTRVGYTIPADTVVTIKELKRES